MMRLSSVRHSHSGIPFRKILCVSGQQDQPELLRGCPDDRVGESDAAAAPDIDSALGHRGIDRVDPEATEEFSDLAFFLGIARADQNFHPCNETDCNFLETGELIPGASRAAQKIDEDGGVGYGVHLPLITQGVDIFPRIDFAVLPDAERSIGLG
jgi:hypothetical protein